MCCVAVVDCYQMQVSLCAKGHEDVPATRMRVDIFETAGGRAALIEVELDQIRYVRDWNWGGSGAGMQIAPIVPEVSHTLVQQNANATQVQAKSARQQRRTQIQYKITLLKRDIESNERSLTVRDRPAARAGVINVLR